MALSNYSELVTAIGQYAWRADVDGVEDDAAFVAAVPNFIALCESRTNRTLRVGDMLDTATITITSGSGSLPADYLQHRHVAEAANPACDLEYGTRRNGRGFSISGGTIYVWPDSLGNVTMEYYAKIPALTSGAPTNWLMTKAPEVYLYGSLMEAGAFVANRDDVASWAALYQKAIDDLQNADVMARYAKAGVRLHGATP